MFKLKLFLCGIILIYQSSGLALVLENGDLVLELNLTDHGANLILKRDNEEKFAGWIGEGLDLTESENCNNDRCLIESDDTNLLILSTDNGFNLTWTTENLDRRLQDCFNLNSETLNWYGGPERSKAEWPIEKLVISNLTYVTKRENNGAIVERYWLSSKGTYIFIDNKAPLIVDQNSMQEDTVCFVASLQEPYVNRSRIVFGYVINDLGCPKEAHLHAVENFLGKPTGHPNERLIRNPIWTTWAKYKKDINDTVVLQFGQSIADHGLSGQLEIDDNWEHCYGSLTFNEDHFPDVASTIDTLKELGFTVSVWTHPFINQNCDEASIGLENGYFLSSYTGNDMISWWNGNEAYHIDFTKQEARDWYISRLHDLQETTGVDTFKFDAGETNFLPPWPIVEDIEETPNILNAEYARTCAEIGDTIEVRSGFRTQDLPVFLRMIDKSSTWDIDNGLRSLITTLLQLNMVGFTMILPDMVGGNGNSGEGPPSAELLARWTQANTFMPTMQFSYLPWDITSDDFDGVAIMTKFVELHQSYSDQILQAMENSIELGYPVNPPIWWVDPANSDALKCDNQYLLGDSILVAPVVESGAVSRDIVIPTGTWKDGNNGDVYEGPQIIEDYPAPIDVLPYFIKQ